MSEIMLHGILNMPLPGQPEDCDIVTWVQFKSAARDASARIEELEAKLATCEKYRDAYDKMGRIGTEAYRDLEAKLAKAVGDLEDATQIISQCTWATMFVKGQYVDRREAVQGYRTTLAELKGDSDA